MLIILSSLVFLSIFIHFISATSQTVKINIDLKNGDIDSITNSFRSMFHNPAETLTFEYKMSSEGSTLDAVILANQSMYLNKPLSSMSETLSVMVSDYFTVCSKYILGKTINSRQILDFEADFVPNMLYDCYLRDIPLPDKHILVFVQFIYYYSETKGHHQEILKWLFNRLTDSQRILLFKKFMERVEPSGLACPVLIIPHDALEKDKILAKRVLNTLSKMQNLNPVKMDALLTSVMSSKFGVEFYPFIQDNINLIKARSHHLFEFAHSIILDSSDTDIESSSLFIGIFAYLSNESHASDLDLSFYIGYGRILSALLSKFPDYYVRFIQDHPSASSLFSSIESFDTFSNISALFDSLLETVTLDTLQAIFESDKAYSIAYSKFNSIKYNNVLSSIKSSFETLISKRECSTIEQFKLAVLELHWIYRNTTITIHSSQKILDFLLVFHSRISSQVNTSEKQESLLPYLSILKDYLANCLDGKLIVKSLQEFKSVIDFYRFVSSNSDNFINDFIVLQLKVSTPKDPFIYDSMIKYTLKLNIFDPNLIKHVQLLRLSEMISCTNEASLRKHLQDNQLYLEYLIKHKILNTVEIELFQFVMKKIKG